MQLLAQSEVRGSRGEGVSSFTTQTAAPSKRIDTRESASTVGGDVLFWLFVAFFCVYMTVTGVLFFHWRNYALGDKRIYIAEFVYVIVSLFLLLIAIFSIV